MGESSARRCRRRRRHLKIQVDIQARKLFLEFSNWMLTHMKDIRILIPGFYTAFRAGTSQQRGLAWGAILEKIQNIGIWGLFAKVKCHFFEKKN